MKYGSLFSLPVKSLALGCLLVLLMAARAPERWRTVAERSGFDATSSYAETLELLERIAAERGEVRLVSFGRSASGRELPLVIVSTDGAFTPQAAADSGKPIVMLQCGIHAGEIDGKEAALMLLRDLALDRAGSWPAKLILLVVPIYNVDGHERVSPYNRPNQNGPRDGMGFRTTADGHDLNRDHLKLTTPEARALAGVINAWRPHLHVDNHVTDGADYDWVLTWISAEAPQLAAPLDAWMKAQMPEVVASTERGGHRVGPYVSLVDEDDPSAGVESRLNEARYSTGYWPLRNRPSILIETHVYKPFRVRVQANHDFLRALLERVAAEGMALVAAVQEAERHVVALGRPGAPQSRMTLEWSGVRNDDRILFPVYDWYHEPSEVAGTPLLRFRRGRVREIEVPWIHRPTPEVTVARPRGYLVLPGWPVIEMALAGHGLHVERLTEPIKLDVETLRLEKLTLQTAGTTYQGLTRTTPGVIRAVEQRQLPAGTLWVSAAQPDFEVAAQLFEPEAPDSLVRWGLLSQVVERKEYIDSRVLESLAIRMLEDDPALAEEWQDELDDPSFAADPEARRLWWYRRTPHWDETVGLLPVLRLLADPALPTEPWKPIFTEPWRPIFREHEMSPSPAASGSAAPPPRVSESVP